MEKLHIFRNADEQCIVDAYNALTADENVEIIDTVSFTEVVKGELWFILWVYYEEGVAEEPECVGEPEKMFLPKDTIRLEKVRKPEKMFLPRDSTGAGNFIME